MQHDVTCPERALWRAVVFQAFKDAQKFDQDGESAAAWLFFDSEDRRRVFSMAELDENFVAERAAAAVLLMAKACARGKMLVSTGKGVRWARAADHDRKGALMFLESDIGEALKARVSCPVSDEDAEDMLFKAVALTKEAA